MLNKKQIMSIVIIATLAILSIPAAGSFHSDASPDEEFREVSSWDELRQYIGHDGGNNVKLVGSTVDAFYGYSSFTMVLERIPDQHRTITIDLNGHTINRGSEEYEEQYDQKLFYVQEDVTLIIKDTSVEKQGGMIRTWSSGTSSDKAGYGGIIYNEGEVIIEAGTFRSNQAMQDGGAIYNAKGATLTVKGGSFSLNFAEHYGGAIYNEGTVNIEGGTFAGNIANCGGAIYNEGLLAISGGFMFTNEAQFSGGAIHNAEGGKVLISNVNISDNISLQGAAIYNESSLMWVDDNGEGHYAVDIRNADLDKNYATNLNAIGEAVGVGSVVWNSGYLSISDSAIEDNKVDMDGGAIANTGILLISGSTFSNNKAEESGGAIVNFGDTARVTISNSTFSGNHAKAGGAIFNRTTGSITEGSLDTGVIVMGSTFDGNYTKKEGGAIYNKGAMIVSGCMLRANTADEDGGGIYADEGNLAIKDTHFENNTTSEGDGGGALYIESGTVDAYGLIAEYNTAPMGRGGAIYINEGILNLDNSMIAHNKALTNGGAILLEKTGKLNIKGLIRVCDNEAMMGKNIYLKDGAKIGLAGNVHRWSIVDFAMNDIYDPITDHFNSELCDIGVFSYNEVSGDGFPYYQKMTEGISELYVDIDLWNQKLGATLVTDWDELRDYLKHGNDGEKMEIALANDICRSDDEGFIRVKGNYIIDLNGFTLDGDSEGYLSGGAIISIVDGAEAIIKDGVGTGRIMGGSGYLGGAIFVDSDSKLIFESGTICNNEAEEGGGIFAYGALEMTGGALYKNKAVDNGGAIFSYNSMDVSNVIMAFNRADDDGGALYVDNDEGRNRSIRNCEIVYNYSDGDGGAIFMNAEDRSLSIVDCIINYNEADSDGGAIHIVEGGISISGTTDISYNRTDDDGGAIYTDERKVVITGNVTISHNHAGDQGGAIYTMGIVDIEGGTVSYNDADEGGAIYINDGSTVNIRSGTTLCYNEADGNGGAIYVDDNGTINLWGGSIIYNTAKNGGAVYVDSDSEDISVKGDLVVMYNDAVDGNGIYLPEDSHIDVVGPLADSATIMVASEDGTGKFTKGFSKYNSDREPSSFFISSEGFLVILEDGEAAFTAKRTGSTGEDDDFIDWDSQIVDYYSISSKNWMSGISGERRLNEINIPGTHDSGMKSTECHFNASIGDFAHMSKMAQTQALYIDEQLEAGVRILDIRINNQHLVPYDGWNVWAYAVGIAWSALTWSDGTPYELEDDGENLWICHGKNTTGGTFYAQDHDGDDLTVVQVLEWIMDFLTLHPTETIMVGFSAEVQGDDEDNVEITNDRIFKILEDMYDEINPSTGKPFIYRVGDAPLGISLTEYPYLKDCRGQIVLYNNKDLGGITSDRLGDVTESYSQDVGYDCSIDDKRQSVYRFFTQHVNEVDLPMDVTNHLTVRHSIGMNVGPTDTVYYIGKYFQSFYDHDIGPMHNADVLLSEFFTDGGSFDQRGKYVGWVKTDGAEAEHLAYVWKSNFPDYLNYATVTVESGLGGHFKQTYKLLVGTTITIPGCIYKDVGDLIFDGWIVDDKSYAPGTNFVVSGDVTFIANWRSTENYCITFVDYDDTVLEVFHYNEGTSAQDIIDLAPSPTKPGDVKYTYTFAGWDPAVTDAVADATYKAVYNATLNKYTVTWMTYDGVSVIETDVEAEYGSRPSFNSPEPTREETEQHTYKFIGWSEDVDSESGKPVEQLRAVTGNVTYYASFMKVIKTFKVTFLNWDDSVYYEGTYAIESEPRLFVPVNNPTRPPEGDTYYEFKGWSPEPETLTGEATYKAQFKETSELRYCVKFIDWDATVISEKMYEAGTSYSDIVVPEDPSRDPTTQFHYMFKAWSPEVPTSGELSGDIVFAATYEYIVNQYTITFVNWDGTQLSQKLYDFGTSPEDIAKPADPTKGEDEHYRYAFAGWSPSITSVMTDGTYTAVYSETVKTYTITWKNYDGKILETDVLSFGDIPNYNGKMPTRPDTEADIFTFQGWSPSIQFVSEDVEYTAEFRGVGKVFSITYDPNGGHFTDPNFQGHQNYQHGYEWLLPDRDIGGNAPVEKDGYSFMGWKDSKGNYVEAISKDDFGDKTFYAAWTAPLTYRITFEEASVDLIQYTIEDDDFTLPRAEKVGCTFLGWTEGEEEPVLDVVIPKGSTGDKIFTAHWEANVYSIEYYDGNTKLDIEPATYTYGAGDGIGIQPAKTGYTKAGWYTTSDFQEDTKIVTVPKSMAEDLKVYAKYDAPGTAYWSTYPAAVNNLVYTGDPQNLITLGEAVGGTAYYRIGSEEFATTMPTATNAGEYRVEYKVVDINEDEYDSGWVYVTVEKASPTMSVAPTPVIRDYDGHEGDLVQNGSCTGGTIVYSTDGTNYGDALPKATDAGEYAVYYRISGDENHKDTEPTEIAATINKVDIPSESIHAPTGRELIYLGWDLALISAGSTDYGTMQYSLDGVDYSEDLPTGKDAGEYTVYYRIIGDKNHNDADPKTVTAHITKSAKWFLTPIPTNFQYSGNEVILVISGLSAEGTPYYRVGDVGDYGTGIPTATAAGTYKVWYKLVGKDGYRDSAELFMDASITKAPISPTVSLDDWVYGDSSKSPVLEGNTGEGAVAYTYKKVSDDDTHYTSDVPTAVGEYDIKATISETDNYQGGIAVNTFSIVKRSITPAPAVTIEGWTYGEQSHDPVVTGVPEGATTKIQYKLKDGGDSSYGNKVPTDAGEYTVRVKISETQEYLGTTVTADFVIQRGAITPTVTIEGWTYGSDPKSAIVSGNSGKGAITLEYKVKGADDSTYTSIVPTDAGDYVVKATVAESTNYNMGTATADFSILKASVTVTANDISKVYGSSDPKLTATITGLVAGDPESTIPYTLSREAGESVDTYAISVVSESTANYSVSTVSGTFTINKAPVTVTANDISKVYGSSDPQLTATISGLVAGDPESTIPYSLTRESGEDADTYVISVTAESTSNYAVSIVSGTFTIDKAPVTVTAKDVSKVYGSSDPQLSVTISGLVSGDPESTIPYSLSREEGEDVGTYVISVTAESTANYSVSTAAGTFTIDKAPVTVTANDVSKVYGSSDPKLTATISGLVSGDPESTIQYTLSREAGEDVGAYVISVTAESTKNYSVSTVPGTFSITKLQATVIADDAIKEKGDQDPVFTYSTYNVLPGDHLDHIEMYRESGEDVGTYTISFTPDSYSKNYDLTFVDGMLAIISKAEPKKQDDGTTIYTSEDEVILDENTTATYATIKIEDKDENVLYVEVIVSISEKDVDERGNERITTTTDGSNCHYYEDDSKVFVTTKETKVQSVEIDAEGKDIVSTTTVATITETSPEGVVVKEESKVEDISMATEASVTVGEGAAVVTTVLAEKTGGDSVSLTDVKNAQRQMNICLDNLQSATSADKSMSVASGDGSYVKGDNDAFRMMADSDITFKVTTDSGSLSYSPDVARTFGSYNSPVTVQIESGTYDDMNQKQKDAVPKNSFVVSVTATSGETKISDLGGDCTIAFPFVIPEGWVTFDAFYLDPDGVIHEERTDFRDGTMHVTMNHHSDVVILQTFDITLSQEGEGEIHADRTVSRAGEVINLTAVPSEGYYFFGWETDPAVVVTAQDTFIMPDSNISVKAIFKAIGPAPPGPKVVSIVVDVQPDKVNYKEGDTFDPTGLVIKVSFEDGSTVIVPYLGNEDQFTFNPSKDLKVTDQFVRVIYGYESCTLEINVESNGGTTWVFYGLLLAVLIIVAIAAALYFTKRKRA